MSLETWKREYYPVAADDVPAGRQAVWHSLKKWVGLRPHNLKRHEVYMTGCWLGDGYDSLIISDMSCALCVHHIKKIKLSEASCVHCPLFKALGGRRCDEGHGSPWRMRHETVEPMIKWLKEALKHV